MATCLLIDVLQRAGSQESTRPKAEFCVVLGSARLGGSGWRGRRTAGQDLETREVLAFGELEALTRALLSVLLSFMRASVTREKPELFELASQLGIKFDQSAGDAEARSPSLSADPAAIGQDQDIETVRSLGGEQRLAHVGAGRFIGKIIFKGPVIYGDLTFSGPQENAGGSGLAATGTQLLN
jgi:hypothetical protein